MMNAHSSDELLAQVYSAAVARVPWEAPLNLLADTLQAWAVQLLAFDKRRGRALFSHYGGPAKPEIQLTYLRSFQQIDPLSPLVFALSVGSWVHSHEHFSDERVAQEPFFQDFLIPYGGRHASGFKLFEDDELAVLIGIHHGSSHGPLGDDSIRWLEWLRPHLVEAMGIHRHLSAVHQEQSAGQQILDRMSRPIWLMDALRGLRYANAAARVVLHGAALLTEREGRLGLVAADDDSALEKALDEMVIAAPATPATRTRQVLRLQARAGEPAMGLSLSALRPEQTQGAFGDLPLVMLVLLDTGSTKEADAFVLQELFNLTPAEADVAARLSRGAKVKDVATQRGVSLETVNTQLKSLRFKTGASDHADLLRRVWAVS